MCQPLDALVFAKNAGILVVCRGFLQTPRAQGVGADHRQESLSLGSIEIDTARRCMNAGGIPGSAETGASSAAVNKRDRRSEFTSTTEIVGPVLDDADWRSTILLYVRGLIEGCGSDTKTRRGTKPRLFRLSTVRSGAQTGGGGGSLTGLAVRRRHRRRPKSR